MDERVDPETVVLHRAAKNGPQVSPSAPDVAAVGRPARRWLKRTLVADAGVAAIAGVGAFGYDYWTFGRFQVSTDDAYLQADAVVIAPKVAGYLKEVTVADNQKVKAGEALARIDDRDYAVALDQAQASERSAEADLANVEALLIQQPAIIAEAKASVSFDDANLKFAKEDNDRYVTLAQSGAGSLQNAQLAVSKYAIARATLEKDAAAVVAAERQIDVLQAEQAKAEAAVSATQAQVRQAQLNLGYATIIAPVDGVVGNRTLRVGQYVQAGTSLMSVVPLNAVYVVANFKETQLTDVRPGQKADVEVDTFSGAKLTGTVDSIAPASGQEFALLPPDNAAGNFTKIVQRVPVKIVFSTPPTLGGLLRPGMSVVPTIDVRSEDPREGAAPVRAVSN